METDLKPVSSKKLQALILTKEEGPNIGRALERLQWLEKVVVLDSYSTDETLEIAQSFPNVSIRQRAFDSHASQWNYGLSLLDSEWVLSLDADYVLSDELIDEIEPKLNSKGVSAYLTDFRFVVFGKELSRDNTTPRPVLFKRKDCRYYDDGHTQRLAIDGATGHFTSYIHHDDRKSLSRWLSNQTQYSLRECTKLTTPGNSDTRLSTRLRKTKVLAPIVVFTYCIFVRGLIFNGWRGWHYTLQRTMVEILLALRMVEETEFKRSS